MLHIAEGMRWLGRVMSCFVTERKDRTIKRLALNVFRHIEHAVLKDVVILMIQQCLDGHDLYKASFLVHPSTVDICGIVFRRSRTACLRIGEVGIADLIMTKSGVAGKIMSCWPRAADSWTFTEIDAYECVGDDGGMRALNRCQRAFVDDDRISNQLYWYMDSPMVSCVYRFRPLFSTMQFDLIDYVTLASPTYCRKMNIASNTSLAQASTPTSEEYKYVYMQSHHALNTTPISTCTTIIHLCNIFGSIYTIISVQVHISCQILFANL